LIPEVKSFRLLSLSLMKVGDNGRLMNDSSKHFHKPGFKILALILLKALFFFQAKTHVVEELSREIEEVMT
jgi:hypothetical protein